MIEEENLDIRTITMGINLLDCADSDSTFPVKNLSQDYHQSKRSCESG